MLLSAVFIYSGFRRLSITEDIFSALPKGKSFQQFNTIIESKNISNQVIFSMHAPLPDDTISPEDLVSTLLDSLNATGKNLLTDIRGIRPDIEKDVYTFLYSGFPHFIDRDSYKAFDDKINDDNVRTAIISAHEKLLNPSGFFIKDFIINDPLGITGDFFKAFNDKSNAAGIIVEDGIVYTKNKNQILVTAKTAYDAHQTEKNIALSKALKSLEQNWNKAHPDFELSHFGTFEIAAENATQVKKDTMLTVVLSLSLILLILIFYYRKIVIPVYFVLPALFSGLFAMGVVGYLRPEISAISLATGAILLGIILDYSFHFFTHLRHTASLDETIKEIAAPLLTGSITTVLALAALIFTSSVVLQDFGLFASITLAVSAVFTLIGLPVILKIFNFRYQEIPDNSFHPGFFKISQKARLLAMGIISLLTIFFFYHSNQVEFDSDLESLSYHPDELKNKETELAGINPAIEKKIYVFAQNAQYDGAAAINYEVFTKLSALKNKGKISSLLSTAQFIVPDSLQIAREKQWHSYWENKHDHVFSIIQKTADSIGFSKQVFLPFENWVNRKQPDHADAQFILQQTGLDNLIETTPTKTTFITTYVVPDKFKDEVNDQIRQIQGVELFDRSQTAALLLEHVRSDFNFILIVTAGIVFITLLLIYGRIELTLLAFLPMLVSWIWILGIAALLDIKFNFVNVVISTFIFGLGDDFSIFVTDGLLNRYKYKKDMLHSYQSAIILSAVTVIIGTGVLFFAKHPAIHSIAAISVIGISCILLISFLFQPVLFNLFVQNRIEKKRSPIPLFQWVMSIFCFTYFIVGCLLFYPVLFLIFITPYPKKSKRKFVNRLISAFAASVIYSGFHVRKKFYERTNLNFDKPSIIIANHSSFLDILLVLMLHPKVIIMVKEWVYKSPLFGFAVRYAGYIYSDSGTAENISKVKSRMNDGYSLAIFPEGTRSTDGSLHRFHKGAFYLAEQLQVDIQPLLIHGASVVSPKNEMLVKEGSLNRKALPRILATDASWGHDARSRAKSISHYFKTQHALFKEEMEDASFLWRRVYYNFIFKGPVIEWYGRIKWKLEAKNYDHYNQLIGNRNNIVDLGCGYGFMSLFLHYKNPQRNILGIDYDNEKIEIAKNVYDKTEKLVFINADITTMQFENPEVIFLNDVLHYLSEENQIQLLQKAAEALQSGGILFIRDGVCESEKHKMTKVTEFLSTRIFSFNKKMNDFHFVSTAFIQDFAERNTLTLEMHEHSKNTSNKLFVLKK
jgi:1-acyl-sn-glycerol-3-phosphate acyltransferase